MRHISGFTMIELMIGVLIGLIVTLASMTLLADSEARRRTQTSVMGVDQSGTFTVFNLDGLIREAGSGYAQSWPYVFGCTVNASAGSTTLVPLPSTMPVPFSGLGGQAFVLAPVLVKAGASDSGSDIVFVNSGAAGFGEIALPFGSVPTSSALNFIGTTTLAANDVVLVADRNTASSTLAPCMVEQIASSFAGGASVTQASLSGTYYLATGSNQTLTSYSADGMAIPLGNPTANNPPLFLALAAGSNNPGATATGSNLYSYNLLTPGATAVALTDGVLDLRAIYGIDTDGDGLPDTWQSPASGNYTYANLTNGSAAAAQRLVRIKQIRIGMIIRTSLVEKTAVSAASLSMFADTGLTYTRSLSTSEQQYRYRVIETTIPLRNLLLIAQ